MSHRNLFRHSGQIETFVFEVLNFYAHEIKWNKNIVVCVVMNVGFYVTVSVDNIVIVAPCRKKKDCNQKKTYTERELKAAVDAIRNRTLGTRKAAQMYGVPRSTLRNKVNKPFL